MFVSNADEILFTLYQTVECQGPFPLTLTCPRDFVIVIFITYLYNSWERVCRSTALVAAYSTFDKYHLRERCHEAHFAQ